MRNCSTELLAHLRLRCVSPFGKDYWPLLLVILAFLLGPGVACLRAQTYLQSAGVPAFTTRLPVENGFINAANGNLHLEIPLGSFPQRGGRQETLALVYDSNIWWQDAFFYPGGWQPNNDDDPFNSTCPNNFGSGCSGNAPGAGWRLEATMHSGFYDFGIYDTGWCSAEDDYATQHNGPWVYEEPNGTLHSFDITTEEALYPGECGSSALTATGYATDGSGYYISVTDGELPSIYAPDGMLVSKGFNQGSPEDTNGNQYTISSNTTSMPYTYSLIDTSGRAMVTESDSSGYGAGPTWYFDVANSAGTTSRYKVKTGTINVDTAFGVLYVPEYSGSFAEVTEVDLPDGTEYQFGYDSGTTSGHYGQLTSMTLPTGGTINYTYNMVTDALGNPYSWVHTRTTPDSSTAWTYTFATVGTACSSGQVNCEQKLTVTKPSPSGNQDTDVYTFVLNGGDWPVEVQYYSGSSTLLATTTQCYSFVTLSSGSCSYSLTTASPATIVRKTATTTTLPIPGSSVSATTEYTWDTSNYGNVTQIAEWNFGTSTSGNPDRITNISYLNGSGYISANILNRPSSVTVKNGSGTSTVAQTNYCYDYASGCGGSAFSGVSSATSHDTTYGTSYTVRGDLTQIQRLIDGTNYLTTKMAYDMTGQVTSSTDSNSNATTYSSADCYKNDNGTSSPSSTSPAATNAYITSVQTALSGSTSACYYYGTGQLATATDANGKTTTFSYNDSMSWPTNTWLPNGGWSLDVYDQSGSSPPIDTGSELYMAITSTSPSTGCTSCRHDQTILDSLGLGRVGTQKLVSDPGYSGGTKIDTLYDSNGRVKSVSNPYRTTSDATYGVETPAYDGLDRTISATHADSNVVSTSYGAAVGSGVSQSCTASTYGYGYPILATDEASKKRQTWTDAFGRVIETDEPDASGSLSLHTCYSYDLNNNLNGVLASDGTQTRSYTSDMLSRLTQMTDPETGTTYFCYGTGSSCNGTSTTTHCSGDPNAVCLRTDAKSITTTYTYDALNRTTGQSYSDGTPAVTYSYDSTSCLSLSVTCYNLTRRTAMSDGSGSTSWAYDAVGRILRESRTIAGVTKTITYTYNLDSTPATVVYPGGRTVTYTTDNAERRTAASDGTDSITYATSGQYAPHGALSSVTSGSGNILSSLSYNSRLQLCRIAVNTSGTAPTSCTDSSHTGNLMDLQFGFASGNNGNIATETNNLTSGRTQNYSYDPLNRIISASTGATSGGDCWGQTFGNNATPPTLGDDALANLVAINSSQCSAPTLNVSVNVHNQITTSGLAYDSSGNGNMTNDGLYANTYTFDAENRINSATNSSGTVYCYLYDGDSVRVAKGTPQSGYNCGSASPHAPTMFELYWRNTLGDTIAETDGSGSTTNSSYNEYVFFDGQRIAQSNPYSGSVNFYFADQLGSTRMVTSSSGTPCYKADFLPYGTENSPPAGFTNTCSTTYRFTGYERDPETAWGTSTGNDYAFARYYNSRIGRFMSADPMLIGDITDPQTLNRYTYVRNNPVNLTDPSGLCGDDFSLDAGGDCGSDCSFMCGGWSGGGGCPPDWCGAREPDEQRPTIPADANSGGSQGGCDGSGDPTCGETNGIPNGLHIPGMGGLGVPGGCTYGGGSCGGMIYGFGAEDVEPLIEECVGNLDLCEEDSEESWAELKNAYDTAVERAKELYPKLAKIPDQLHHVIPKYLGGDPDGALARIPAAYHQLITNYFRQLWPYGQAAPSEDQLNQMLDKVYAKLPILSW
jgi:RHS repeat-associated protein